MGDICIEEQGEKGAHLDSRKGCLNPINVDMQRQIQESEEVMPILCGVRDGLTFVHVIRPDMDGKCPEQTKACSNITSPENTICYRDSQTQHCPVTDFVWDNPDNSTYGNDYSKGWVRVEENKDDQGNMLLYTKTEANNLPLTTFSLQNRPCLDSTEVSKTTLNNTVVHSSLSHIGCHKIQTQDELVSFDPRYRKL